MLVLNGEHAARVLAFTADSSRLVAVPVYREFIDVWTLVTGVRTQLAVQPLGLVSLAMHPLGQSALLAHARGLVNISLAGSSSSTVVSSTIVDHPITSRNGEWIAASAYLTDDWRLFGLRCDANGDPRTPAAWQSSKCYSDECPIGAIGSTDLFVTASRGAIIVREFTTGKLISTAKCPINGIQNQAASADGSRFAVIGNGQLYLWEAADLKTFKQIKCRNSQTYRFAFHPTRPILAAIQDGQTLVKYLDVNTGQVVRKFQWKLGVMQSVAFSPDGNLAAASSESGKIVVWDVDE